MRHGPELRLRICFLGGGRLQFGCGDFEEFLKDVIGEQAALRCEADCLSVVGEEISGGELIDCAESVRDAVWTEFLTESGDGDAVVQSKAQKPGFFVLSVG